MSETANTRAGITPSGEPWSWDAVETALAIAGGVDRSRTVGEKLGPLADVPVTTKININPRATAQR